MTVFYTSDLHFGHENVAKWRGFTDVTEQDSHIARNWREAVKPDDIVWVLGDVTGRKKDVIYALEWLWRLPGIKHLITGNHDECWPARSRAASWQWRYLEVFESVQAFAHRKTDGLRFNMSHFPYHGDHTDEDRATEWRLQDVGLPIVHGHTHSADTFSWSRFGTPQIHVGLDAWDFKLVTEQEVVNLIGFADSQPKPETRYDELPYTVETLRTRVYEDGSVQHLQYMRPPV